MNETRLALNMKESQLIQYLEGHTTEEIIKIVQNKFPFLHFQQDLLNRLKKLKLAQPVLNTLILYVLATNNQRALTYKLLVLGYLCREFNIRNSSEAITFFKQYYAYQIES